MNIAIELIKLMKELVPAIVIMYITHYVFSTERTKHFCLKFHDSEIRIDF